MRIFLATVTMASALVATGPVLAQSQQPAPEETPSASELEQGTTADELAVVGMAVVSSDGKQVGTVSRVLTDGNGDIFAIYASVGALRGLNEWQVKIEADDFAIIDQEVVLLLTEEDVHELPDVDEHA